MKVLVIGGTRGVGHAVVAAAHGAGHTLTVMARHAGEFAGSVSGLRTVVGDALDSADIVRATGDQDAVVWAVGAGRQTAGVTVFSQGTAHLLAAMDEHGIRRLLCVTRVATETGTARGGFLQSRFLRAPHSPAVEDDKIRQEAQIEGSGLDWTIVRPAPMTNGKATGLFQTLYQPGPSAAKRIARADVAAFIVDNLAAPEYVGKTVFVTA